MSEAPQQQTLVFSGRLAPGMKRIRHEWSPGVREWLEGQVRGYRSDPTSQEIVRPTAMELAKLGVDLFGEMHGLAAREGMEMLAQRIREFKAHRRLGPLQLKYGRKKVFKRKSKLKAKAITPKAEAAKPVAGPVAVSADVPPAPILPRVPAPTPVAKERTPIMAGSLTDEELLRLKLTEVLVRYPDELLGRVTYIRATQPRGYFDRNLAKRIVTVRDER